MHPPRSGPLRPGSSSFAAPCFLLSALLLLLQASGASAQLFPPTIIFGDSLSDTGAALNLTDCRIPAPQAYFRGRWGNGPVWPDYLSQLASTLGQKLTVANYAFGGATACSVSGVAATVPSLSKQIALYLNSSRSAIADSGADAGVAAGGITPGPCLPLQPLPAAASASATCAQRGPTGRLFIVFIGHNDFLALPDAQLTNAAILNQTVNSVLSCRVAAIDTLLAALAKGSCGGGFGDRVVVWNLAPVDQALLVPAAARPTLRTAITAHNAALAASLAPLRVKYPNGPAIQVYDVNTPITTSFTLAASSGFLNAREPCVKTPPGPAPTPLGRAFQIATTAKRSDVCATPDLFLSYDGLHPSSLAQKVAIAEPFATRLGWLTFPAVRR